MASSASAVRSDGKSQRQRAIRKLVAAGNVHTQDELVEALRREGITVTQATVSRDIVELGLVRAAIGGRVVYILPESVAYGDQSSARRRLGHLLRDVPVAFADGNAILVLRTAPGMANVVAVALDACALPEIAGTVAGDDTIFIALHEPADRERIRAYLNDAGSDDV